MNIAWIITGFAGYENDMKGFPAIHNLSREISSKKNINLDIYSFYYPINKSEYEYYNARVFSFARNEKQLKSVKLKIWKQVKIKFAQEYEKKKYNLLHSIWSGESGHIASQLSKKYNIPFITQVCGGELAELKEIKYGSRLKFWQKKFVNQSFNVADKIIIGSDFIKDRIKKYYSESILNKTVKIPFGIDHTVFAPSERIDNEKKIFPRILNIASATPVKNHILLIEAFDLVKKIHPDASLTICGYDEKKILESAVRKSEFKDSIIIKGFVDFERIPEIINSSDIFVLSSIYESQNLSALESAFCGIPVVGTNTGIMSEITDNVIGNNNPEELAKKIIYVVDNYDSEKKYSIARSNKLIENYSLRVTSDKLLHLYNELADK